MKTRQAASMILSFAAALALGACSVAPHARTIVLPPPKVSATASPAPAGKLAFELMKATAIPLVSFDQVGYFGQGTQFVYGWLDKDHLIAIGVKPVASASSTSAAETSQPVQLPQAVSGDYTATSAKGLVGQILSMDWQTGKPTELHTVQDQVILAMGLSHDKTKLWYTASDGINPSRLAVTDNTFTHDFFENASYLGTKPVWSSSDKLLGYFSMEKKAYPLLTIFDGAQSNIYVIAGEDSYNQRGLLSIDDDSGDVVTQQRDGRLMLMNMTRNLKKTGSGTIVSPKGIFFAPQEIAGSAVKAALSGDMLVYLSADGGGRQLNVIDMAVNKPVLSADGIINFALSDDGKYICLVRQSSGSSADVSIAQWSGGKIANEKVVFKGFVADGNIFFSPDDAKLYIEGNYGYASLNKAAMVLEFK